MCKARMHLSSSQALWRSVHKLKDLGSCSHALAYTLYRLLRLIRAEDILLVIYDIRRLCTTQRRESLRLARITDYHIRYCSIANVSAGMLTTEHIALRVKIYQITSVRVILNVTLYYTHHVIFRYVILSLLLILYVQEFML